MTISLKSYEYWRLKKNSAILNSGAEPETLLGLASESISRGLGPAQELLHHQIVDLVGVLNPVIYPPVIQNT
ncbi:hypothetical protein [Nostoc sp.]|uniref:hypothetical protein n=1 Tax=Nostoc sp. TaxID=1180 RepID=UPI002FF95A5B